MHINHAMAKSKTEQFLTEDLLMVTDAYYNNEQTKAQGYMNNDRLNALFYATFIALSIDSMDQLGQLCIKFEVIRGGR